MVNAPNNVLLLHADEGERARVAALLAAHNVTCVGTALLKDAERQCGSRDIAVVLTQITPEDGSLAADTVTRLRRRWSGAGIIVLAPPGDTALTRSVFRAGAADCLEEPADEAELVRCVNQAIKARRPVTNTASQWLNRARGQLRRTYMESTRALVAAVDAKDPYAKVHSLTVASYAGEIGKRMMLSPPVLGTIRAAALLHDVGKIGVPDGILTKAGPLTNEEFEVVKRHPQTALDILGHVSFLADERPLILHHHERYDGQGYPGGLARDRTPIGARILAVADALDTMFSPRCYKPAYGMSRVRAEIIAGAGTQFDPKVTEVTLKWLDEEPPDSSTD